MFRRLAALLLLVAPAVADVTLADLFQNFGVLQRGIPVPVWGTADPGEQITVSFEGKSARTTTGKDGRWQVEIGPFKPVAARRFTVTGKNKVVLPRMSVGDVWVCSGQSNMGWPLRSTDGAEKELATLRDPRLFLYTVRRSVADEPASAAGGTWQRVSPENAKQFSAVAYYFGKEMRKALAIPIGLIHTSWGGTPAEAWTSRRALEADETLQPIVRMWDKAVRKHPEALRAWKTRVAEWKAKGAKGRKPRSPAGPRHPHRAAGLYNGMIAPLVPYGIRGVIWYQGEANAARAKQYRTLFPAMIRDWRRVWRQGDFPFYFVQLANWRAVKVEPSESAWAELREAQRATLAEPNTGMAVTIDIGDAGNIHPRNKREVGRRLALIAQAELFGKNVVPSGPLFEAAEFEGGTVRIRFRYAKGLAARSGGTLSGFAIAGSDKKFYWAHARVDGETVVVSHPDVKKPASVRYAWADNPICNLVNGAGLPASPFRTDGS